MKLREYLDFVLSASSIELLWREHTIKMAEYGFDRLLYGYTRYRTSHSLGDPEDFVILTNHDHAYTDVFLGQGLYFQAPMVQWALNNEGACSWSVMREMKTNGALTEAEKRVIAFNISMGVTAGYTLSFQALSSRAKGAIGLTARRGLSQDDVDEIWKEHGDDVRLMNNVVHLKIITLPYSTPYRTLTSRQREVLEWVGDGKTTQDIAVIMGLTPATVEKHLRKARQALAVDTTAQAVMKAAFANQMFIMDA